MSKPRKRKPREYVRAVRQAAVRSRWDKLGPEERSAALAPATAASPRTKPGRKGK